MPFFTTENTTTLTVFDLYEQRDAIQTNPDFQRQGDIWNPEKKRLLVDSILNHFDVPKIYLAEYTPPLREDGRVYRYAIIDGKQRLETLWQFMDGDFPLADDFVLYDDESVDLKGRSYGELVSRYPKLAARFDGTVMSVVIVQTDDRSLIDEMFSRLNEAVPLNAPEKRNAIGGPMAQAIRDLTKTPFFTEKLPRANKRYQHYDTAAKFLYLENQGGVADTKKVYLDRFVKDFRDRPASVAESLRQDTERVLSRMESVFSANDPLLTAIGMLIIYYLLFREIGEALPADDPLPVSRSALLDFEQRRKDNRVRAEQDLASAAYDLVQFDKLVQSPNDASAIAYRFDVLKEYVLGQHVIDALMARPVIPLDAVPEVEDTGVYAVYYTGDFPAYRPLAEANRDGKFAMPIYIGSAPRMIPLDDAATKLRAVFALSPLLREDARSIEQAENLKLDDFHCRYVIAPAYLSPLGESLLIKRTHPLWNTIITGFAQHSPHEEPGASHRSMWDTLHPGRAWAFDLPKNPLEISDIMERVASALTNDPD